MSEPSPTLPEGEEQALVHPVTQPQPASIPIGPAALTAQEGNRFTFIGTESRARVRLTILAPDLARVDLLPEGMAEPPRSWAVARPEDAWPAVPVELEKDSANGFMLRTPEMSIWVTKPPVPLQFQFYNAEGILLSADAPAGLSIARQDPGPTPYIVQRGEWGAANTRTLLAGERLYGFGERTGPLNKRGSHFLLWSIDPHANHSDDTWAMYSSIPFFVSVREQYPPLTYGIFLDSAALTEFDLGASQPDRLTLSVGAGGGTLTYYFFAGYSEDAMQTILARYTELTGRMPLPPRWALGHHQCRWSYFPDSWVQKIAREFRARKLPCDALWLDIDYMDGYRDFTWHPQRFPDPKALTDDLHAQGYHVVTILDPGVKQDPSYHVYQQGVANGYFCQMPDGKVFHGPVWPGMAAFPDFSRAEVREWWGRQHAALLDAGIDGIWNDMNEPTLTGRFAPELDVPRGSTLAPQVQHGPGRGAGATNNGSARSPGAPAGVDETLSHTEFHNAYGAMMARAAYEGLERLRPNQRPFVLTRSAFAGSQRFTALWTGDNTSTWEHIRLAITQCLNIGLSGIANIGVDIGGFWESGNGELLTRWYQLGVLLPFCRNHSCAGTAQQEPWAFGEPYESSIRRYLELRYRLLPYLNTLFHKAATTGAPIMRPLFWHYLDDLTAREVEDQFLLGRDLLAAPIYQPGQSTRRLYLPAGEWASFWSGERWQGRRWVDVRAPLDELPLFVRGGAILPLGPVMQHTAELPTDPLTLALYASSHAPNADEPSILYEDDGSSTDYRSGGFCQTAYRWEWENASSLLIHLGTPQGDYRPERRQMQLEVHLPFSAEKPQPDIASIQVNGTALADGWQARKTRAEVLVSIHLDEAWEERSLRIALGEAR
ncbi:MAG TPA: glycoside hydrolase family 31 protein [Ktedonobacterales bacterium]|jgi:alpha-glucosidase